MKIKVGKNDRIICGFLVIIIVILITFILLFNILMKTYIEKKAVESLEYYNLFDRYYFSNDLSEDKYIEMYDKLFDKDEDLLFMPLNIYIDINDISEYKILAPFESELCLYIRKNIKSIEKNRIYKYSNKKQDAYYILMSNLDYSDNNIMYVDISAVLSILHTVNKILIYAITLAIIVIIFLALKSKKILDKSDENEKKFFSNASHELKTPLMAIQGYAEGLEKEIIDGKEASKVILKESDRMNLLISSILELSKLDSGMIKMNFELNDVREIIYDSVEVNSLVADNKNIEFDLNLESSCLIKCDEKAIFSVLSNIISNAVRYASKKITIDILSRKSEIEISISNDGEWEGNMDINRMFDRFYKGIRGNTGLGLAISKQYVDMHHGMICVERNNNITSFKVKLPKNN